jgi:rubrerythrin
MTELTNLIKIFEYALNQEQTGISFFQTSLPRLGLGAATSALQRLIQEEEKHIAFISEILVDIKGQRPINLADLKGLVLEPTNYFDERSRREFLEQCIQGSMVPDVTVFNTAWLIEKDLSDFYAKMAQRTEGKSKEALLMLAGWEAMHEKFFREYRDKLSEVYAQMPWGG